MNVTTIDNFYFSDNGEKLIISGIENKNNFFSDILGKPRNTDTLYAFYF